jgi:hypothetical protein
MSLTLHEGLTLAVFAALAVLCLPAARLRRAALALLTWAGNLALLAAVGAGGLFAVRPQLAPPGLSETLAPLTPAEWPALGWLAAAAAVVAVGLPLLTHLRYARGLARQAALIDNFRRELLAAARRLERQLAAADADDAEPRPHRGDVAAAVEAMRAVAGAPRPQPPAPTRTRLVKDCLR